MNVFSALFPNVKYLHIAVIRHRNPTMTVFTPHTEGLSHVNLDKSQLTNDFTGNKFTYDLPQSHNWLTLQPSWSILDKFAQFYLYLWSNFDMIHFSDGSWICVWRPIFQWGEIKWHRKTLHTFFFLCIWLYVALVFVLWFILFNIDYPLPSCQALPGSNRIACCTDVGHWSAMFPGGNTQKTQVINDERVVF